MQKLGEILYMVGAGYLAIASLGPLYFPWDVLLAVGCVATGFHLGGFRHRWWPRSPIRDAEHEFIVKFNEDGRPRP